jgi:hypothetical protein
LKRSVSVAFLLKLTSGSLGVRQQPLNVAFARTRIDLQLRKLAEKSTAGMIKPASTRRSICQEPGRAISDRAAPGDPRLGIYHERH